jgi:long-chain fatty acid transport protein
MKGIIRLACALVLLLVCGRASASPLFELTGDTLGTGGFQGRVRASGSGAAYFNPALLSDAEQGLEISEFVIYDWIRTTYDARPSGVDVPENAVDRFGDAQPAIPTKWLEEGCEPDTSTCSTVMPARARGDDTSSGNVHAYQGIGLVNHLWPGRITLAFYALVPMGPFTTGHSFFVDEREQRFSNSLHPELFSDRLTAISLAFGGAVRLTRRLSLGVSMTLVMKNDADATAYTGDPDDIANSIEMSTKLSVINAVAPHGGITYKPVDRLSLSATVHSPQKMEIKTRFANILPTGDYQEATRIATLAYVPWIFGLGGVGRVIDGDPHTLDLSALATFERWSQYVNRQNETPKGRYAWDDIFVGTLGVSHTYLKRLTTFVDASYRPTPVPKQTGRTNYVDNDRWSGNLGVQWLLPLQKYRVSMRFGAQAQVHVLPERHQKKLDPRRSTKKGLVVDEWPDDTIDRTSDPANPITIPEAKGLQTNNPGFPGFGSEGIVVGGGLNMAVLY